MSEVKRYKYARTIERPDLAAKAYPPGSKCFETAMCDFVLASDYAALETERDSLKNSLLAITTRHFAEGWKRSASDKQLEQYLSAGIAQLEAERDAALAECERLRAGLNEAKYRVEQGRVWAGTEWKLTGLHPIGQIKALEAINSALSAKPNNDGGVE